MCVTWQVAFAGRSNVGKSSLLRAMAVKAVSGGVHSEHRPGTTRQITFYNLDQLLRLVDLPGYGECLL